MTKKKQSKAQVVKKFRVTNKADQNKELREQEKKAELQEKMQQIEVKEKQKQKKLHQDVKAAGTIKTLFEATPGHLYKVLNDDGFDEVDGYVVLEKVVRSTRRNEPANVCLAWAWSTDRQRWCKLLLHGTNVKVREFGRLQALPIIAFADMPTELINLLFVDDTYLWADGACWWISNDQTRADRCCLKK
jgi:hypothetical protein